MSGLATGGVAPVIVKLTVAAAQLIARPANRVANVIGHRVAARRACWNDDLHGAVYRKADEGRRGCYEDDGICRCRGCTADCIVRQQRAEIAAGRGIEIVSLLATIACGGKWLHREDIAPHRSRCV